MGGLKRKIPVEKVEKKDSRAVAFSKRKKGLYSKASELCLLSDAQIAIIATPVSSNSNASFYTFGHSSVDGVVASFLANQHPREDLGLGFWWDDESLAKSENPEELRGAINSMSTILNSLKQLRLDAVQNRRDCEDLKMKGVLHGTHHHKQTLNLQSSSASLCIQDNFPENFEGFNKNTEEQVLAISENSNNNNNALLGNLDGGNQELHLDQYFDVVTKPEALTMNLEMNDVSMMTTNQNPFSDSQVVEDEELVIYKDLDEDVLHLSDLDDDQILAISDSNNNASHGNVGGCSQELDYDLHITDYEVESKSEGLSMNDVSLTTRHQNSSSDSEAVQDRELVTHRDLYDDSLHLSDLDENEILPISDNNSSNVFPENWGDFDEELDLDQLIDFETDYGSLLMNLEMDGVSMVTTNNQILCSGSKAVEDERLAINRNMNEDNLHFSDFFNELSSVAL